MKYLIMKNNLRNQDTVIKVLMSTKTDIFSNKETYIMSCWSSDFPTHSSLTYEEISSLSSRSRDISIWFKNKSEEFLLYKEAPSWFLDAGKSANDWTLEIQEKYSFIKKLNKEYTDSVNRISFKAKQEMAELDQSHKNKLIKELTEVPELVLELINSQMLPFETHLKAFEFKTKEEAKDFINSEVLIFKTRTYEKFMRGDLTVNDLVDLLFEK